MTVVTNIWNRIILICDKHGERLLEPSNETGTTYVCPKKYEKELCKLSINSGTYEKLLYKISELICEQQKKGIIGPIQASGIKIGFYKFAIKEEFSANPKEKSKYLAYVSDVRDVK